MCGISCPLILCGGADSAPELFWEHHSRAATITRGGRQPLHETGGTLIEPTSDAKAGQGARRRPYPKRTDERARRRLSGPAIVSIVLHVIVGAALLQVLLMPYPFHSLFATKEQPVEPERISFLALPKAGPTTTPGKSGGNGRPETPRRNRPAPPLVAPTEVPSTLPPVNPTPATPAPPDDEGTGPLIGRGGPTKGIRPSYSDPRIWVPSAPVVSAPKSADARMDSVVASGIERARDSIAALTYTPNKFERGDWTVEKEGRKYGIDQRAIHLGKFSIPTALLALLPMNAQGNPLAYQREKEMASLRAEIQFQSQRAMNEEEFRRAVKELRQRKEREHQQQEKARAPKTIAQPEAGRTGSPTP